MLGHQRDEVVYCVSKTGLYSPVLEEGSSTLLGLYQPSITQNRVEQFYPTRCFSSMDYRR